MSIMFEDLNEQEQAMAKAMVAKAVVRKDVAPTEALAKIAKARVRLGLDITVCPCGKDKDRGCISAKCYREIQENGICHCGCFKKIGE